MMPILPDCSERSPDEQERINRLAADISNLYPSGGLREDWSLLSGGRFLHYGFRME